MSAVGPVGAMIDVVLPVYNAVDTIASSVDSVLEQTFSDFRLIIVDDGSTDGTSDILADYARRDPRITLLRQENSGIVDALTAGIACGNSEFIARQDADDISLPLRFETQRRHLMAHEEVLAVGCCYFDMDAAGRLTGVNRTLGDPSHFDPTFLPAREPYILHPLLMMRRSAFSKVGGYRHMIHAEDADLYWRLSLVGELRNLPQVLGAYRINPQGVSSRSTLNARIQAISSQLAALSFRRRCAMRPDIVPRRTDKERCEAAGDHLAMCRLFDDVLDAEERDYLIKASSLKLLQTAGFRPILLEASDVSRVLDHYPDLMRLNDGTAGYARHLVKAVLRDRRQPFSLMERRLLRWRASLVFELEKMRRKMRG